MTFKNFICKGVLVFTGLLLIGWLGQYIYIVNGEIDWMCDCSRSGSQSNLVHSRLSDQQNAGRI